MMQATSLLERAKGRFVIVLRPAACTYPFSHYCHSLSLENSAESVEIHPQTCWRMGRLLGPRLRPGLPILDQGTGLPILDQKQNAATSTDRMMPPRSTACVVFRPVCSRTSCSQQHLSGFQSLHTGIHMELFKQIAQD